MAMRLGMHTHIFNVFSTGYLAYLACVDSWLKLADSVVVVDGGSTDGSAEILQDWVNHNPKLRVVSDETTRWSGGYTFAWPQISANVNRGYVELDVDVSIYVDADNVADVESFRHLREELESIGDAVRMIRRFELRNGSYQDVKRAIPAVIDRRAVALSGHRIGWGQVLGGSGLLTDSPLWVVETRRFTDPILGGDRFYYAGTPVSVGGFVEGRCGRFGHFFFTWDQCMDKCQRWNTVTARFSGRRRRYPIELAYEQDLLGIAHFLSREEMLSLDHLPEMRRVIQEFYKPGMLGGRIYARSVKLQRALYKPIVYARKLQRKVLDYLFPVSAERI